MLCYKFRYILWYSKGVEKREGLMMGRRCLSLCCFQIWSGFGGTVKECISIEVRPGQAVQLARAKGIHYTVAFQEVF
jgi:hypothetical protein